MQYPLNGTAISETERSPSGRAPLEDIWRRNPDGGGSRVNISPRADRARSLCDESVGCDNRGVTLMGPEALSELVIDADLPLSSWRSSAAT